MQTIKKNSNNKLIIANWKMNGDINKINHDLKLYASLAKTNSSNILYAIPMIYLAHASYLLSKYHANYQLVTQDISIYNDLGAHTGEISAIMVANLNIKYSIIGHSERRAFQDHDTIVMQKITNAIINNITPIYCIGESLDIRQNCAQNELLLAQLQLLTQMPAKITNIIIAYEPIWAIGTGKIPTIMQLSDIFNLINNFCCQYLTDVKYKIIYGGSVNPHNIQELSTHLTFDGFLIGGASLKNDEFINICQTLII